MKKYAVAFAYDIDPITLTIVLATSELDALIQVAKSEEWKVSATNFDAAVDELWDEESIDIQVLAVNDVHPMTPVEPYSRYQPTLQ